MYEFIHGESKGIPCDTLSVTYIFSTISKEKLRDSFSFQKYNLRYCSFENYLIPMRKYATTLSSKLLEIVHSKDRRIRWATHTFCLQSERYNQHAIVPAETRSTRQFGHRLQHFTYANWKKTPVKDYASRYTMLPFEQKKRNSSCHPHTQAALN